MPSLRFVLPFLKVVSQDAVANSQPMDIDLFIALFYTRMHPVAPFTNMV